jgi:hypothetical protein
MDNPATTFIDAESSTASSRDRDNDRKRKESSTSLEWDNGIALNRRRTFSSCDTMTQKDALEAIWSSLESKSSPENPSGLERAIQETAALLLKAYSDLIQPATKAMMELEETKVQLQTLQDAVVSKDREMERLRQSEKQARASIAVSDML